MDLVSYLDESHVFLVHFELIGEAGVVLLEAAEIRKELYLQEEQCRQN